MFARLAYDLGRARASGVLRARGSGEPIEIAFREGRVPLAETDALGRRADAALAAMAERGADVLPPRAAIDGGPRSLHLVVWCRRAADRKMDLTVAEDLARAISAARIGVATARAPEASLLDDVDRRILAALGSWRDVRAIAARARASRYQVLSFLSFLDTAGALEQKSEPIETAEALLGVSPGADIGLVRSAFRRLARTLHPDLHPGLGDARRRDLEARLARLSAAYAVLSARA